ncbi:DNA repair protein endonuclease SAE2/CtIP C-terminus-domain-containing protein [Mrakia frigida]|uniref:SAE2 C-terminal domain-containing protein n=1 Tax=Mrakia frigida TaxID=29902 RepID=UPI003FCC15E7
MGEPYQVYRYTPKSIARPPKTVRSEPRDAGSSSREASNDAQQRVRSDGDAPLPPPPPAVKIEPDLFTVDIPNPRIPRVLYDSQDERNARYEDPYYRSPESEERDEERRRAVKDPTAGMTPEQKSIFLKKQRNVPASETRKLYAAFKGRGRYNPDIEKKTTINDEFQINKSKNDGRDYAFNNVVRGKEQRKQLHARDCECCRGYYEAVGPLAPLPQGPRWKSAPPESDEDDDDDRKRDEEIQKHRQEVSRHRDEWAGPPTPPFYWDIGFPDTQKVALINEAAERIEQDKRARIEAEAR